MSVEERVRVGVRQTRDPAKAERVMNGQRAAVLSAAVHHALAALKTGRVAEATQVLEAVV